MGAMRKPPKPRQKPVRTQKFDRGGPAGRNTGPKRDGSCVSGSQRSDAPGKGGQKSPKARRGAESGLWLYGQHAVLEALGNPKRRCSRLLATAEAREKLENRLSSLIGRRAGRLHLQTAERDDLAELLPPGAVHQGLALAAEPLAQPSLADLLDGLPDKGRQVVCALDHVTDPQNVGAILRSAAAFGVAGLLTTRRNAAPESGALAKAASGALERVPYLQVGNLAQALESLKNQGFWVMGLASEGSDSLPISNPGDRLALVLGAEGDGLRRLTRERCDLLLRLPTRPPLDQLNVSNAAAIAFYELLGRRFS